MADKTSREYVICPCRGVTRGEVEDAIRKNRITDLKVLCQTTNAGTKCGGCREDLEKLIHEILGNYFALDIKWDTDPATLGEHTYGNEQFLLPGGQALRRKEAE